MRLRAAERFDLPRALLFDRAATGSTGAGAAGLSPFRFLYFFEGGLLWRFTANRRRDPGWGERRRFCSVYLCFLEHLLIVFLHIYNCVRSIASSLGNSTRVGETVRGAELRLFLSQAVYGGYSPTISPLKSVFFRAWRQRLVPNH